MEIFNEENKNYEEVPDELKFLGEASFLRALLESKWTVIPTDNGPVVAAVNTEEAIKALKQEGLLGDGWALKDPRVRVFVLDNRINTFRQRFINGNEGLGDEEAQK